MIYLSGVPEIELANGKQVLVVGAWLSTTDSHGEPEPKFLGFDPKTHTPHIFALRSIKKIHAVLVR